MSKDILIACCSILQNQAEMIVLSEQKKSLSTEWDNIHFSCQSNFPFNTILFENMRFLRQQV